MKAHTLNQSSLENHDTLFDKDEWLASDIGLLPDVTHSIYLIKFTKITTPWLKKAAKKFVRFQAATKSFATCRGYIRSLNHFDDYLKTIEGSFTANNINRSHVVGLMQYLTQKNLKPMTRGIILINLRVFHQIGLLEGWLDWPEKPIIYNSDLPRDINKLPKFISNHVINQLKAHLHNFPQWMQNFITVLMETGRRISEVCSLSFDCLEHDGDGDLLLRVKEQKLKRIRLIPISKECIEAIKAQQNLVLANEASKYLFPSQRLSKSPTVSAPHINRSLNQLAIDHNIKDSNGIIWQFSSHQFRHTIGTQMINSGVPQVMVQQYLGHESPEMTARYAHIHNETMKKAFTEYQEKIVDIKGKIKLGDEIIHAKWLKRNIMSQALPNGMCSLPLTQNRCPHANACLTCTHFRTSKQYLERHKTQLEETTKVIENAKQNGWQRIEEMNNEVACNLKSIIFTLENTHE
ncbi:tyrosine-type recombinase/integrase [Legionella feeleii]|uniref:Prophage integrase n=1 Tax=Legionella feeleii TaxID=453 RepID=A0A0W0U4C7_9GAMM|nr:tyrosine-type recombinase/integrase [Legionella feeleii]KTD02899.1 site specific recombinase [Legionella feeleii]SPX59715.1 Prophage integrase [Legionella feeleii]